MFKKGHKPTKSPCPVRKPGESVIRAADGDMLAISLTRRTAIAAHCMECLGWEDSPADCTATACPLYTWRPKRRWQGSLRGNLPAKEG